MSVATPILGLTPLMHPDASLVTALERAGARGCLDLGHDPSLAARALRRLDRAGHAFAVRIATGVTAPTLPAAVDLVVLDAGTPLELAQGRPALVVVTSVDEARAALAAGAAGLIASGQEAGGRVGEDSTFVLLQALLAQLPEGTPIWARGGLGPHTAAAAIAGGAVGLVVDVQLALLHESTLPDAARRLLKGLDGAETRVVSGHRVLDRPGFPVDALAPRLPGVMGPGPTDTHLVPMGQDAALAEPLAATFRDVAGLIAGLRDAVGSHAATAAALTPLAPGHGVSTTHASRYPIVQGPMTRVSDTAAFAEAVSTGGALPFLALSLLRGPQVAELVAETAARLPDQPWGIGILGFVPPELRAEQLAALGAHKPPVALIAGGRPSQARELEAQGIATYLHVPSPGLLDLFLGDGATRFVFEGRECGGHIGPRSSFVLWEQVVTRLLQVPDPSSLDLLFAGGIHDARSAAMVATLAAPLVARGARIGVLMGTAYLFTDEAVSAGAIGEVFQQAALDATATVSVATAPGHATRCVPSPFVDAFEARRAELVAEGAEPETIWSELETMNLGRLRIASKGLVRETDGLHTVDADRQRAEGMFMIGQVAALRSARTTVAALHAEVSEGATLWLAEHAEAVAPMPEPEPVDIAIVGMAGFFPGAADVETFWAHLLTGHDAITEVPRTRWNTELYYDPEPRGGEASRSKWGGFLPEIPFDPVVYGIPPKSLAAIEPVQLLALEAARRALADAGYDRRTLPRERASVIFGAEAGTDLASAYGFRGLWPQYVGALPPELDAVLPKLTEDSFPGVLANVIAGRIANRLDLGGLNFTVDAACASSLAALDMACKELVAGGSDVVLCGGADLHNAVGDYLLFSSTHALSPTGRCATFDASADGIALGEGVGVVVLKRLADAERDGDRIYAVVKAVAGSSDGRSLGLTAPRKLGQTRALERAYARAGVGPRQIGLVEAHGTGTVVGDRTELEALTEAFSADGVGPGSVTLGSVKSNIGHTKCAAGLAGLIKASLALHHRVLPPTLHVSQPNPGYASASSPFVLRAAAEPWSDADPHAAVSAFGFGGTNFHVVLAGAHTTEVASEAWPAELLLFRDVADVPKVRAHAAGPVPPRLRDLAHTLALRGSGPVQLAVVATDRADLIAKLDAVATGRTTAGVWRAEPAGGRTAWLFPGQGSQTPGMFRELFALLPTTRRWLTLGAAWAPVMLPPPAWTPAERAAQRDALTDTRVAQPALGITGLAAADLLELVGLVPDALAGHSYGELVALAVAGALPIDALLPLSAARGEAILAASPQAPGTMLAVAADPAQVAAELEAEPEVVAANHNAPGQIVLSGTEAGIARVEAALAAREIATRRLPVAAAFHSPVVADAAGLFAEHLATVTLGTPSIPVWSNTTAAPHTGPLAPALSQHIVQPVRWAEQIEAMYASGVRTFVEAGPGRVLSRLVGRILGSRPHLAVCLEDDHDGLHGLLDALARLAAAGQPVDVLPLLEGRGARAVDLEAPPAALPATTWIVDGHRARPLVGEPPAHALHVVTEPVGLQLGAAPAADREEAVLSYLESMRQLAESQRQVMLGYLGATAIPAAEALAVAAAPEPIEVDAEVVQPATAAPEDVLIDIVSDRTGYPRDLLDLDLDLEADLSIDSIKRIEILGALSKALGLSADDADARDELVEALARVKTLRGILALLAERLGRTTVTRASAVEPEPRALLTDGPTPPAHTVRFLPTLAPAPINGAAGGPLPHRRLAVVGADTPLAAALVAGATARGATATRVSPGEPLAGVDGVVWLEGLHADPADPGTAIAHLASTARTLFASGPVPFLTVTGGGGGMGLDGPGHALSSGLAALTKSIAHEWPGTRMRRVDVEPDADPAALAEHLLDELIAHDDHTEVGYRGHNRRTVASAAAPLGTATHPVLEAGDVVLVTGGARGITARVAIALAERYRPVLELVGRSPMPPPADAALAEATDEAGLRTLLVRLGRARTPREANDLARRELADRELRATFSTLDDLGVRWRYHVLDVRDAEALGALMADVVATHGHLDAVIHGAGITEDKLLRDKTDDSFRRVFDTKVTAALALSESLAATTKLVVFFSSVAGAYGNRGQTDYAAANATLDALARQLDSRIAGRAVSINWGPWGGGGMVGPELERAYAAKGIALIEPDDGVQRLLDELERGSGSQVILMRASPDQMIPVSS